MENSDELPVLDEEEQDRLGLVLASELRLARDDPARALDIAILKGAVHGDASLTSVLAERSLTVLLLRREFDVVDRFFLAQVLKLIAGGVASNIFSQLGDRRGGVRNGEKSLAVALAVVDALEESRADSLEEAWAIAAEEFEVGEDMAKRHWMRWKKTILWSMSDAEICSPSLKRAQSSLGEFDP